MKYGQIPPLSVEESHVLVSAFYFQAKVYSVLRAGKRLLLVDYRSLLVDYRLAFVADCYGVPLECLDGVFNLHQVMWHRHKNPPEGVLPVWVRNVNQCPLHGFFFDIYVYRGSVAQSVRAIVESNEPGISHQ